MGNILDHYQQISALDGFSDVELRGGDNIWNKKSDKDLEGAIPGASSVTSTVSRSNYKDVFLSTSSGCNQLDTSEETNPYDDYDRAMKLLEPR